jgi:hypothetical protein
MQFHFWDTLYEREEKHNTDLCLSLISSSSLAASDFPTYFPSKTEGDREAQRQQGERKKRQIDQIKFEKRTIIQGLKGISLEPDMSYFR